MAKVSSSIFSNTIISKRSLYLFLWGGTLFIAFVIFSYIVHRNHFTQFDFDMTVRLQDHVSRRFDSWFSILSDIGSFEPILIILLVLLILRRKIFGILTLGLFGFLHLLEIYGKTFVDHLPPPEFMVRTQHLVQFPQFHVRLQNSYPSGHLGRAFFMTTFLGVIAGYSTKLSRSQKVFVFIALALYDMVMGISRIYLGEHWTTDVIGGSLLGAACGLVGVLFVF